MDAPSDKGHSPLPGWLAIALVVGTSAAILVLEILPGRLLAPYVGVSLETYTGIIGTVLAGIAVGAWMGGIAADRVDPRRLIPALLVVGGALAIATVPTVRALGDIAGSTNVGGTLGPTALGFLPSATVLSAVPRQSPTCNYATSVRRGPPSAGCPRTAPPARSWQRSSPGSCSWRSPR